MSRDGSGNYALPAGNPVVNGTTISSTVQNNTMTDVATALTASLCADGQKTATANQPMGGFKHTSVGDATARTQYPSTGQVQDGALITVGSVAGTDTYTGSLSPAHVSFTAGQTIIFKPGSTNTGASTLALNGGTAKSITKNSVALVAGDLVSGTPAILVYTGTAWNLTNPYSTGTLSASIFLAGDGAVGAPSFSFTSDPDTGIYRVGANDLGITTGGTLRLDISTAAITSTLSLLGPTGAATAGNVTYSFGADTNTGIYSGGADYIGFAAGGVEIASLRNIGGFIGILMNGTNSVLYANDGAVGASALSFFNDTDTGIYRVGNNDLGFSVAATLGAHLTTADFEIVHATIPKLALYVGGSERAFFRYTEASATARIDSDSTLEFATNNTTAVSITSGGQTGFIDGVVGTPSISFINDTNTGIYSVTADDLGISVGGVLTAQFRNVAGAVKLLGADGTVSQPFYAFDNDADCGLYRIGTNDWGLAANGALVLEILSGQAKYLTFEVGFREIPQNSQSVNYTLVLADSGKHIYHPSGGGAGDTFTIPANSSVAYALGTALTFVNGDSNAVSIAITTDTMTLAGTTTTGTRTLGQNGVATAIKTTATTWIISGTGLT